MKRDKWTVKKGVCTSRSGYRIEASKHASYCGYPQWVALTPEGESISTDGKTNICWSIDIAKEACREHQLKVEFSTYCSHFLDPVGKLKA